MVLHVISVGGSLIVPDEIDTDFLKTFRKFILKRIEKGDKFILISGGGKICRKYQSAALEVVKLDDEERDWLGIHSTRLNAHLLRSVFKDVANPFVVKDYIDDIKKISFKEKVLVGAGWKPGWSTDYCAALLAQEFNSSSVINLSNIDYVYSEDPRKNPNATKFEKMSWDEFRKIVGDVWDPGMNAPFDPIASKLCHKNNIKVAIMNGKDIKNLENYLDNKKFKGTVIG